MRERESKKQEARSEKQEARSEHRKWSQALSQGTLAWPIIGLANSQVWGAVRLLCWRALGFCGITGGLGTARRSTCALPPRRAGYWYARALILILIRALRARKSCLYRLRSCGSGEDVWSVIEANTKRAKGGEGRWVGHGHGTMTGVGS